MGRVEFKSESGDGDNSAITICRTKKFTGRGFLNWRNHLFLREETSSCLRYRLAPGRGREGAGLEGCTIIHGVGPKNQGSSRPATIIVVHKRTSLCSISISTRYWLGNGQAVFLE